MAKGDDAKLKKKNKALRKKLRNDPASAVSARVAAIIASKKRRLTGKRRQCQGMCFSLPSPDDPYNDRQGKPDTRVKRNNKKPSTKVSTKDGDDKQRNASDFSGCPSKFLCSCLNSIQDSLAADGELDGLEKPFIANSWGIEFWKSYSLGKDILDDSGTSPSAQQIGWIASTAADSIQEKENEQITLNSPFLLYLVPSQERAAQVRSVCKPLKAFGIHTVSLHPAASVEHQVNGLKSCDPEFLVATPERVWEIVSLKAIDISVVSLLVVDTLDTLSNCLDTVKRIRDAVSVKCRVVVFQGCKSGSSVKAVRNVLREPLHTLSLDE